MKLRKDELTEEQLQLMTKFHSKNQTSRFAPSWVQSTVSHGRAHAHSRGGSLMSANGCTRSSRGGLVFANSAMRSSNIERKKEVVQFYDFW